MSTVDTPEPMPADGRKYALAMAVKRYVTGFDGWKVEAQADFQVVLVKGRRLTHLLHLIITMITFGFWLPVWAFVAFMQRRQTLILAVDEYGSVFSDR